MEMSVLTEIASDVIYIVAHWTQDITELSLPIITEFALEMLFSVCMEVTLEGIYSVTFSKDRHTRGDNLLHLYGNGIGDTILLFYWR